MSTEEFNFSLDVIKVPVTINNQNYMLQEADAEAAAQYENARFEGAKVDPESNRVLTLSKLGDLEPLLVHLCLFNGDGKRVPLETIRQWPSRVVKPLYHKAMEISELDVDVDLQALERKVQRLKEREQAAKNALSATTDGSE